MKKLGVLFAVFFVLAFALPSAHGADEQKAHEKKKAIVQMPVAQPESKNADAANDKLIDFYKTLTTDALTFTGVVIALFAGVSLFLVIKGYQLNKEARKELDEIYGIKESIYKLKDSTRDYLYNAKESMDKFVTESEIKINGLIEQGKKDLEDIRKNAEGSAKEAKSSEDKSKAIESFMEGYRLGEEGKHEEAIAAYDKVIELDPKNALAYNNKGVALDNLGKYEDAIALYDKTIELDPKYADAYYNKAVAFGKLGRYADVIAACDKAIAINPKHVKAYINKGVALNNLGKCEEAIAAYDTAIGFDPKNAPVYINKGVVLNNLGRYAEAVAAYDKAVAIDPNNAVAYSNKGNALIYLAHYDDAIKCFIKALELYPNDRTARINMALALQKRNGSGDSDEAKKILNSLLKENDKDAHAARAHALLGERGKMLSLVRILVADKPDLKLKFRTELEFEAYRDNEEFKAIVGE